MGTRGERSFVRSYLDAYAHQGSAAGVPCSSALMVGVTEGHDSVDLLARVVARETRSPSPASDYQGVKTPEHIADALNRMARS